MNQSKPHVLIISNNVKLAYNTLACLASGGKVFVMGSWGHSVYHLSRFMSGYDLIDKQALAEATPAFVDRVNQVCRLRKIDWIVPADVTATHAMLTRHGAFDSAQNFPMPAHEQFLQMHDKWRFSQVTTAAGATHLWQMHYHDLPLHLLLWFKKNLRPQPVPTWHLAGELPPAQPEKNSTPAL